MQITDIPTDTFNQIIEDLVKEGWIVTFEYEGIDSWIDYGKVVMEKEDQILTFEWTNWDEGSVEGPDEILPELQVKYIWKL